MQNQNSKTKMKEIQYKIFHNKNHNKVIEVRMNKTRRPIKLNIYNKMKMKKKMKIKLLKINCQIEIQEMMKQG